jgi:hypothetical protein
MAAAEEREESKHVEQEGDHRIEILSGSDLTDQRLGPGRGFGEGQDTIDGALHNIREAIELCLEDVGRVQALRTRRTCSARRSLMRDW